MAIQLARVIGEQRKPISPFEGLADVITKTGENIQAQRALKAEKEQKKQALKDAMASNISVLPIKASPQQQAEYERYVKENLPKLAVMQRSSNVTPAQYQDAVNNFKYGLKDREIKYGEDLATFEELNKRKEEGTHSVKEYEDFLIGTPDREETQYVPDYSNVAMPNEEKKDSNVPTEGEYFTGVKEKKETIKGQQGYFSLPFEEQKKIDTKKELEKKTTPVMPYMLDAAKGMLGKDYDFSYVITTDTSKGGREFDVDVDKLEKDAVYAANMFANPPEIAPNKEFELLNRGIERQAITELLKTRSLANLEQNPELIAQTKYKIAYDKFKGDAAEKIYQDQLKIKEERQKGKGGMTFNFGNTTKTKQDTYTQGKYNTEKAATSLYDVNQYEKEYKKYADKNKEILDKQAIEKRVDRKNLDNFYRQQFDKAQNDPVFDGKTSREVFIRANKKRLSNLEDKNFISFNNADTEKTATFFITEDNKLKKRPYFPSGVIYDDNGNILAIEASAAVKQENGQYVKNDQSLEIIPLDKDNYNELASRFPDLFKHAKENLKVDLKYSEGAAPAKKETSAAPTKQTATKTNETKKEDLRKKYNY